MSDDARVTDVQVAVDQIKNLLDGRSSLRSQALTSILTALLATLKAGIRWERDRAEQAEAAVAQAREELRTEALVQARLRRSWDDAEAEKRKARAITEKAIRLAKAYGEALGDKATRRVCEQFEQDEAVRALSADGGKAGDAG